MADLNGGRAVVDILKAEGVRYIFGIVGSTFLDVLDALYDDHSVEYINVRHEQAAAFMADGLARVTGQPGVCLVTSGPGATNLLTGVAAAYVAHSPVVTLVGGTRAGAPGQGRLPGVRPGRDVQAGDQARRAGQPGRAHSRAVATALRTAMSGRRGPVFVEIPRDVLSDRLAPPARSSPPAIARPIPSSRTPRRSARRRGCCDRPQRPLLIVGGGVSWADASDLVVRLSEQCGSADDHGLRPQRRRPQRASALHRSAGTGRRSGSGRGLSPGRPDLAIGTRLAHFTTHFDHRYIARETPIVQIDIDGRDIGRYYPVAVASRPMPAPPARRCWTRCLATGRAGRGGVAQGSRGLSRPAPGAAGRRGRAQPTPMKPQRVYAELRRALPPDTIVALDAGAAPAYGYDRLQFSGRAASSRRWTSAASASRSRRRWAPSSAGPTRPCWRSTATAAS